MCVLLTFVSEIDIETLNAHKHCMNPESIYRHIGEVIRMRRQALRPRLTQEALAQRVAISRASLANIETGRQNVLVHQLYALAQALGLQPGDFLLPVNQIGAAEEPNDFPPTNLSLKPKQKQDIFRLIPEARSEPTRERTGHGKQTKR
jgi:transcriptional regulator with XRE-family HTH domain